MADFRGVEISDTEKTQLIHCAKGEQVAVSFHFMNKAASNAAISMWKVGRHNTAIDTITLTNQGDGYVSIPGYSLTGDGNNDEAVLAIHLEATGVTIGDGGAGYTAGGRVELQGVTGTAPVFTITGITSGVVTALEVETAGDVTALPSFPGHVQTLDSGSGSGLTITPTFRIASIEVVTPATGYIDLPTIAIEVSPSGDTATADIAIATQETGADCILSNTPLSPGKPFQMTAFTMLPGDHFLAQADIAGVNIVPSGYTAPYGGSE